VAALQLFDAEHGHSNVAALEDARRLEKPGKTRRRAGRSRQRRLEGFPLFGAQAEALAIGKGFLGAGEGALQNEFADGAVRGDCCDLERAFRRRRQPKVEFLVACFDVRQGGAPSGGYLYEPA
jgi:hypothetical protein